MVATMPLYLWYLVVEMLQDGQYRKASRKEEEDPRKTWTPLGVNPSPPQLITLILNPKP